LSAVIPVLDCFDAVRGADCFDAVRALRCTIRALTRRRPHEAITAIFWLVVSQRAAGTGDIPVAPTSIRADQEWRTRSHCDTTWGARATMMSLIASSSWARVASEGPASCSAH